MRLLITGGAGFIGSHFVHHLAKTYPHYSLLNLDKLTYAGSLDSLDTLKGHDNYRFIHGDICDSKLVDSLAAGIDGIVHFAAETHVDRSIQDATPFLKTNVQGTHLLLEAARKYSVKRYIQISTDEVYGDRLMDYFTEASPLCPSNPYAASKASADLLALSYYRTYGVPVIISRCSNNYGSHQYPEKLIPFFIKRLLEGKTVPLYGNGSNIRDWLHVDDHCRAIDLLFHQGQAGEVYNISANEEHSNLEVTHQMLDILKLPKERIEFVPDRLGHDLRYAIDATKLRSTLAWKPIIPFEKGFKETVRWYRDRFTPKPTKGLVINKVYRRAISNQQSAVSEI